MQRFEEDHVHRFYEESSQEFSATRYQPWPKVAEFYAKYVQPHDLILDAGSGNGRNTLYPQRTVSVDYSASLLRIASTKQNGLGYLRHDLSAQLPLRPARFDVAISVAVIHHLSTPRRRKAAVDHLVGAVKPGGYLLVYVWSEAPAGNPVKFQGVTHLAHAVPAPDLFQPTANDVFVSWKNTNTLSRYYHLFTNHELPSLFAGCPVTLVESGQDRDNYYVIYKKI